MTRLLFKKQWLYLWAAGLLHVSWLMWPGGGASLTAETNYSPQETRINVANQPGSDLAEKLAACIQQLGPTGGICDATSITGRQTTKADPFAGSDGMVKILLGKVTIETSHSWGLPDRSELAGVGRDTVLRLAPGANSNLVVNAGEDAGANGISIHDLT